MSICAGCSHPGHTAGECRFNGCFCQVDKDARQDNASPSMYDVWLRVAVATERIATALEKMADG